MVGNGGLRGQAAFIAVVMAVVNVISPAAAARPALPAPLCALVTGQIICYDEQTATPRSITPSEQRVTDYAFAPDGNWLVYRAANVLSIISVSGGQSGIVIDTQATPPVAIDQTLTTLTWSPDGATIAYITADGLRLAFPPTEHPRYADITDRPYRNLRFSPNGSRLAAQVDDGGWSLFAVTPENGSLRPSRTIDQAAEIAWLDDNSLVVAALSGGLIRINAESNDPPAWTVDAEHFTQLFSTSAGQVLATHPDPGDTIGSAVSISADGKVTPLGNSKIDSRIHWGPDGRMMLYITSGTPILVDRSTGAEDMLPIRGVSQVAWSPPPPRPVTSLSLDGDLYFLAPDGNGTRQLWRLVGRGSELATQVTHEPYNIIDFAISHAKTHAAVTTGGQMIITSLDDLDPAKDIFVAKISDDLTGGQPDWRSDGQQIVYRDRGGLYLADINRLATPDQTTYRPQIYQKGNYRYPQYSVDGKSLLVQQGDGSGSWQIVMIDLTNGTSTPTKNPPSSDRYVWGVGGLAMIYGRQGNLQAGQINTQNFSPVIDNTWQITDAHFMSDKSLAFLRNVGWSSGPDTVQLYTVDFGNPAKAQGLPGAIPGAKLSPTGRFAAGVVQAGKIAQLAIMNLQTGQKVRIVGVDNVSSIMWIP
jgi:WD40 repeat protein